MMFSNNECSEMEAELKAEVARLRELLSIAGTRAEQWHLELTTERAAHEAAKAERDAEHERACKEAVTHDQLLLEVSSYRSGMMAAEARVAELEGALRVVSDRAVSEALLRQDALDQARAVLEETAGFGGFIGTGFIKRRDEWLRAHPATPDHPVNQDCVMLGCHGVVVEDEPATPAATGAEPSGGVCWHCMVHLEPEEPPHCEQCPRYDCCDEAGCEEPGCTDRVAAEKEQGT